MMSPLTPLVGTLLHLCRLFRSAFLGFWFLYVFIFSSSCEPVFAQSTPLAADLVSDGQPIDTKDLEYQELFLELQQLHGFSESQLQSLFADLAIDRRVLQLMDRQGEAKPYYQYRSLFMTPLVIAIGKQNLAIHRLLFDQIEERFAVDREIIVAIWAIETKFGTNQGTFNLFTTLNTLFAAYPRRSAFYRQELIHLLTLCRDNGLNPRTLRGSYAGAFGQAQFMPSSFNKYAVDFDGDRRADIVGSLPDTFASIAHYLQKFGWTLHAPVYAELGDELHSEMLTEAFNEGRKGRVDWRRVAFLQNVTLPPPPEDLPLSIVGLELAPQAGGGMRYVAGYPNMQAISEYNHSNRYSMTVAEMAEAFKN